MNKYLSVIAIVSLMSCGNAGDDVATEQAKASDSFDKKVLTVQKNGITLTEFTDYPVFSDAELTMVSPKDKARVGTNDFEFEVKNFKLGEQTVDAAQTGFRDDIDGQNIKFFYSGHLPKSSNTTIITENLSGGENYIFAVLARSYNLSIHAASKGFVMSKISIGDRASKIENAKGMHVVPISPIGSYEYEESNKVLLDFFLVNTTLSDKGNYVLVTIDNTEFEIRKWAPFVIEGLPAGMHFVSYKLMDAAHHLIPGPFNDMGKIEFTLKEKAALLVQ